MSAKDRQAFAGIGVLVAAFGGAAVILAGLLAASLSVEFTNTVGITDIQIHRTIWGFLTTWGHSLALYTKDRTLVHPAETTAAIRGYWFAVWFGFWFYLWVFYELCEGVAWPIRAYLNLARHNSREHERLSAD